jgi:LPS sulfotransferase NodH
VPLRVLYLAGWGRNGSTLLAALIAQLTATIVTGEARWFWRHGVLDGWPCSCGHGLRRCERWAHAVDAAAGWDMGPAEVSVFQAHRLRTRHYPGYFVRRAVGAPAADSDHARYGRTYAALYRRLAEFNGVGTLVDSSKYPVDAHLLAAQPGIDLRVVHLLRDPRGVAHSWASPKPLWPGAEGEALKHFRPASSSAIWSTWNLAIEGLLRGLPRLVVRYEDLAADPVAQVRGIAEFAGLAFDGGTVDTEPRERHMFCGNPVRFTPGRVQVTLDDTWKRDMTGRARLDATLPAAPLLARYGYPLRP